MNNCSNHQNRPEPESTVSDTLLLRLVDEEMLTYEGLSVLTKAIANTSFSLKGVTKLHSTQSSTNMTHNDSHCQNLAGPETRTNASDALLLRLVDEKLLTYEGLSVLTKAIANGSFNSKDVTIRNVADIILRPMNEKHLAMGRDEYYAWPIGIPRVVVQGIVDVLSDIMETHRSSSNWYNFSCNISGRLEGYATLESSTEAELALHKMVHVHPSWSFMIARALGRFILTDIWDFERLMKDTSNMHMYGPWTRELLCYPESSDDENYPRDSFEKSQLSFYLSMLPTRFPNLRLLELCFFGFGEDDKLWSTSIVFPPEVEEIVISEDGSDEGFYEGFREVEQILEALIPRLAQCLNLRILHTHYQCKLSYETPATSVPKVFQSITSIPSFMTLNLITVTEDKFLLAGSQELVWCRRQGGEFVLDTAVFATTEGFSSMQAPTVEERAQFREIAQTVRVLHLDAVKSWDRKKSDFGLSQCSSLHELVAAVPEQLVDLFVKTLPHSLSSLTLALPASANQSDIDEALRLRISQSPQLDLTRLRIVHLHELHSASRYSPRSFIYPGDHDFDPPLEQKDPRSIFPLTSAACDSRSISLTVWN